MDLFPVLRSIFQGCSLSPLLYILSIEPFYLQIKANKISGLKLPGTKEKTEISQFADDNLLICTNYTSIFEVFNVMEKIVKLAEHK